MIYGNNVAGSRFTKITSLKIVYDRVLQIGDVVTKYDSSVVETV